MNSPQDELPCTYGNSTYPVYDDDAFVGPIIGATANLPLEGNYKVFVQANYKYLQTFYVSFSFNALPDPDLVLPLTANEVQVGDYPENNVVTVLDGQMQIYWKIEPRAVINFAIVAQTRGWVGIGFNPDDDSMKNCDMYVGSVSTTGHPTVMDMWSTGQTTPVEDQFLVNSKGLSGVNSVMELNGTQSFSTTTIKFRRLLNTADSFDSPITNEMTKVVFAFNSDTATFLQHDEADAGLIKINFFTGKIDTVVTLADRLQLAHSATMSVGWLFFVTAGIFLARFGHHFEWWFGVHVILMLIGMLLSLAGFIMALIFVEDDFVQTDKLILAHSWIGLFVVIGGLLQPVIGFIADLKWNPNRTRVPIWPDKIHWYIGRYAYAGALLNMFLGMLYLGVNLAYYILFAIWLLVVVVTYHFLELWLKQKKILPLKTKSFEMDH